MSKYNPSFSAGVAYWDAAEASVDGMLGGYGHGVVPLHDATFSRQVIRSLFPQLQRRRTPAGGRREAETRLKALDVGAGIGRVTSTVLLPLCTHVDLVEPVPKFVTTAGVLAKRAAQDGWRLLEQQHAAKEDKQRRGVRMFEAGLQFFDPRDVGHAARSSTSQEQGEVKLHATFGDSERQASDKYDLVWVQWCSGHLSELDLVAFLVRAREALTDAATTEQAYIVVKENICLDDAGEEGKGEIWDDDDHSVMRSDKVYRRIFDQAKLEILRTELQPGFPDELYAVRMYVLR